MHKLIKPALLALTATLTLAACAPTANNITHNNHRVVNLDLYYPLTPGLEWEHASPGKNDTTTTRITHNHNGHLRIEQRNTSNELTLIADLLIQKDGIYLEEITTGEHHRLYNPGIMVLPNERNLATGNTWSSTHDITETTRTGTHEQQTSSWSVTLEGSVNTRQIIRTNQLTHDAYEITLHTSWATAHDQIGRNEFATYWIAPFTGLVTTPDGKMLTSTQLTHVERAPHE